MLKLTNSFCRYLKLTYDNVNHKTHSKQFCHLSIKQNLCSGECHTSQHSSIDLLQYTRQFSNKKLKSFNFKQNKNTNDPKKHLKKHKQMSDPLRPNLKHFSIGGIFDEESNTQGDSSNEWQKQYSGAGSAVQPNKEACVIPSNFRVWESVEKNNNNEGSVKFKVLSYNVLAQYLLECHPYLYTECAPQNLTWNVRAARLYDEITKLAPDILCLQEVQVSHLSSFYAKFEQIGYVGIFKQKTGQRQDGCAIYFKKSLFELLDHVSVEFYQPELPILNRDNIGIMVKLLPRNYDGPPIVIATTHLLYNPKRTDVRLAQTQLFLAEIDRFAYFNTGKECGHLPIILTGDFNSTPDSAVIQLLDTGHVNAHSFRDSSDWRRIGVTDNCQHLSVVMNRQQGLGTDFNNTKIFNSDYRPNSSDNNYEENYFETHFREMFNTGTLNHCLNFKSTYDKMKPNRHLEATTFQDYWITVDYIYYSRCSRLKLRERLRLPTESECSVLGILPNEVYGSDHLALAAVFELLAG